MIDALKVMILEDRAADQELIKRQVLKYEPKSVFLCAEDKDTFLDKIDWFQPNIILSDYNLPDYTGLDAFIHVKEYKPTIPFIFVTGGLPDNDPIAKSILSVADGFVFKDNIASLHVRMKEIIDHLDTNIRENAELISKKYGKKVKILKVLSLLSEASDFKNKKMVLEILQSLADDIAGDESVR